MSIGYKVVMVNEGTGEYTSCANQLYPVKYKIGEWSEPQENCGPLALFSNKDNLYEFMRKKLNDDYEYRIFECKYILSERKKLWFQYNDKQVPNIQPTIFGWMIDSLEFPQGTILADKIKLIAQV